MSLLHNYPLTTTFAGVDSLQADGISGTGDALASGIGDRLRIENGVMVARIADTDAQVGAGNRSEITAPKEPDAQRWYVWEMQPAASWPDTSEARRFFSLMQIHDTPDGGDAARAPNFLLLYDGRSLIANIPASAPPAELDKYITVGGYDLAPGTWVQCALHVKWDRTGAGFLSFYADRKPLVRIWKRGTAYDDALGPYLKLGCYDYAHLGAYGSRECRYRNVRIYDAAESYGTVLGGVPRI